MAQQVGSIAAGHQATARAGAEVLSDGGNAVDAAVAAVFAACTCEPTLTGPGGSGFATVHLATGEDVVLDFFATVPGKGKLVESAAGPIPVEVLFGSTTQTFNVGPQSCAVPGFVAGVLTMHEKYGRLPLARVLEPGVQLAKTGLALTEQQAYCHHLLDRILVRRDEGKKLFAPDGPMLGTGDHFVQPDLSGMIAALADDGLRSFYHGDIAREIVAWSDEHGGLITMEDLATYEVMHHHPVAAKYRDLEFRSPPQPSSGGALVAFALQLVDAARTAHVNLDEPDGAELFIATMIASNAMRGSEFDSYLYGNGLFDWLLSDESLERGRSYLDGVLSKNPAVEVPDYPSSRLGSTTHLSVIDREGNAVAMTTSTGCGSGEFVGSTGIHLNNMLGEEDLLPVEHKLVPGDRLTSMMAPSILLADGRPVLATGSAGSNRIRSAVLQVLIRVIESRYYDASTPLAERLKYAVTHPRVHAEFGTVHVEPGYESPALDALTDAGHHLTRWPNFNLYFGGVNMVAADEDGTLTAASDPRRGGGVAHAFDDGSIEVH